jgi:hypothetical protein
MKTPAGSPVGAGQGMSSAGWNAPEIHNRSYGGMASKNGKTIP